jgi:hypothetical protein
LHSSPLKNSNLSWNGGLGMFNILFNKLLRLI